MVSGRFGGFRKGRKGCAVSGKVWWCQESLGLLQERLCGFRKGWGGLGKAGCFHERLGGWFQERLGGFRKDG